MLRSTRLHVVAAAVAVLFVAAGCGGGDDSGGSASDATSETSSVADSESADASDSATVDDSAGADFASLPGDQIADAAKADMKELDSVHYAGSIDTGDSSISLDITASASGDCTGSLGIGDGTAELLSVDGMNWYRPDEAFWRASAPDTADQIIAAVGDKWVVDNDATFSDFCDLGKFFDNIFSSDDGSTGTYEATGTDTVDGQEVVKVVQSDDDGETTGYVLTGDDHWLLKLEREAKGQPGGLDFSGFNDEVEVTAPGADEVIDLDQL